MENDKVKRTVIKNVFWDKETLSFKRFVKVKVINKNFNKINGVSHCVVEVRWNTDSNIYNLCEDILKNEKFVGKAYLNTEKDENKEYVGTDIAEFRAMKGAYSYIKKMLLACNDRMAEASENILEWAAEALRISSDQSFLLDNVINKTNIES